MYSMEEHQRLIAYQNIFIAFSLGLISEEEKQIKLNELKKGGEDEHKEEN